LYAQKRVPVKVIDDESQAKLIFDSMRREILRLLSKRAFTEKQLSDIIGISPPSIGHHLKALTRGDLISEVRREAGSHGIVQKWYMSNAQAFVVDRDPLRNDIRRYFMPMDIERTRGVVACLSLLRDSVTPSTRQMESLTRQICTALVKTARNYDGSIEDDPERTIHRLYVRALRQLEIIAPHQIIA